MSRLADVPRDSLVRALVDVRKKLVWAKGFDERGLKEIAQRVRDLEAGAQAIELELRHRSLVEHSPLLTPMKSRAVIGNNARSLRLTGAQRVVLIGLWKGEVVIRIAEGKYRVEAGEIGGTATKKRSMGVGGRVGGDWRSGRRRAGERRTQQIIERLLERGLVWSDEYGYIVLSEFGRRVCERKAVSMGLGNGLGYGKSGRGWKIRAVNNDKK